MRDAPASEKDEEECCLNSFFIWEGKYPYSFLLSKFEIKGSKWKQSTAVCVIELTESLGSDSVEWHQGKYCRGIVMVTDSSSVEPQSHLSVVTALIRSMMSSCTACVYECAHVCVRACVGPCLCFSLLKSPHGFLWSQTIWFGAEKEISNQDPYGARQLRLDSF